MSTNWLADAIAKETAYDEGYEAGKQAMAEGLISEVFSGVRAECVDSDGYFMPGAFMNLLLDLKNKYGVK